MKKTALLAYGLIMAAAFCCRAEEGLPLVKTGEHYQIRARADTAAEGQGKLLLEIIVIDGWKLNPKAPLLLKLAPGKGLKLTKTTWSGKDAARKEKKLCRFEIPYSTPQAAALELQFNFIICNDMLCQKKKFTLSLQLGG